LLITVVKIKCVTGWFRGARALASTSISNPIENLQNRLLITCRSYSISNS
jgi:hypothetical protein